MRYTLFTLFSLFFLTFSFAQNKSTLSGTITDAESGEAIINAKIYIPAIRQGAVTNTYGFYSLTVESGTQIIEFRSGGMETVVKEFDLTADIVFNIEMSSEIKNIGEVTISAKKGENVNSARIGQIDLDVEKIKTLPAFMGEVDIIKAIQLLPGVSSVSEGGQGFYVRGGGPDQNLVLLDEGVVYNAAHLFGFFSVFNVDAIKSVTLDKRRNASKLWWSNVIRFRSSHE